MRRYERRSTIKIEWLFLLYVLLGFVGTMSACVILNNLLLAFIGGGDG